MIREVGGTICLFEKKKYCSAKSDENIICSTNCKKDCKKIKTLFTKLPEKWGYIGEKICLFLCPSLRGKKFVSGRPLSKA